MRHETGGKVVMNCACHSDGRKYYLVSGQESHCQLYNVSISVTNEAESIDSELAHKFLHLRINKMGVFQMRNRTQTASENGKAAKMGCKMESLKKWTAIVTLSRSLCSKFLLVTAFRQIFCKWLTICFQLNCNI
jgi:hypothetical protein